MGQITLSVSGSFPDAEATTFSAEYGGHADAIGRAIMWLVLRLPAAVELDHQLHEGGNFPALKPFGKGGS